MRMPKPSKKIPVMMMMADLIQKLAQIRKIQQQSRRRCEMSNFKLLEALEQGLMRWDTAEKQSMEKAICA